MRVAALPLSGTPEYIVQVQDSHLGFPAGRFQVYEFHVDWDDPTSSTLIPTQSLVPRAVQLQRLRTTSFSVSSSRKLIRLRILDSLSYGYMMQRLTYRDFGHRQMLLLDHTVAADGDPIAGSRRHPLVRVAHETREHRVHGKFISREPTRPMPMTVGLGVSRWTGMGNIALGFNVSGTQRVSFDPLRRPAA